MHTRPSFLFLLVPLLLQPGCKDHSERDKLRAEAGRPAEESEKQNLPGKLEAVQNCTVKGSIFIASREGTNLKPGRVSVFISDTAKAKKHFDEVFTRLTARCRDYRVAYDGQAAKALEAANRMRPHLASFQEAETAWKSKLGDLQSTASVYTTLHKVDIRVGADRQKYQLAGRSFGDSLARYHQAAVELGPYLEEARTRQREVLDTRDRMVALINGQMDAIFSGLPTMQVLKTDANGEFQIKLPRGKEITIAAMGQRAVGEDTKECYWLSDVTIPDKDDMTIVLGNDSLRKDVPEYSDRLLALLPNDPPQLPAVSTEDALANWSFTPRITLRQTRTGVDRAGATTRSGNVLTLGTRIGAELLDEAGNAVGLSSLDAGEVLEIEKEDDRYVFFKRDNKPMRIRKDKIPKPGSGN